MDNARLRRGKTSLHEKFGEGLAILVAIGFLNASYGLVFVNHANLPERAMSAHAEIVECVGASGMLGGQSVDLALAKGAAENENLELRFRIGQKFENIGSDASGFESRRDSGGRKLFRTRSTFALCRTCRRRLPAFRRSFGFGRRQRDFCRKTF